MKAYYKTGWGITFIVMGVILLVLNLMLLNMGAGRGMQLILCLFFILMGVLYLTMPAFELTTNEIIMFNLFGMPVKRYPFKKLSDIQVMENKVYINADGQSKRVRVSKTMVKSTDWDSFILALTGDDLTRELHNI
jgi:membrane protein CcdC involved in cytochrome C biogenesis